MVDDAFDYRAAVLVLRTQSDWNDKAISVLLGYSGYNGTRDVGTFLDGRSKRKTSELDASDFRKRYLQNILPKVRQAELECFAKTIPGTADERRQFRVPWTGSAQATTPVPWHQVGLRSSDERDPHVCPICCLPFVNRTRALMHICASHVTGGVDDDSDHDYRSVASWVYTRFVDVPVASFDTTGSLQQLHAVWFLADSDNDALVEAMKKLLGRPLQDRSGRGGSATVYRDQNLAVRVDITPAEHDDDQYPRHIRLLDANKKNCGTPEALAQCHFPLAGCWAWLDYAGTLCATKTSDSTTTTSYLRVWIEVMKYNEGKLFSDMPIDSFKTAMEMYDKLGAVVAWLHSLNLAHGDLKPQNIFYDDGNVTLIDFTTLCPTDHQPIASTRGYYASIDDNASVRDNYALKVIGAQLVARVIARKGNTSAPGGKELPLQLRNRFLLWNPDSDEGDANEWKAMIEEVVQGLQDPNEAQPDARVAEALGVTDPGQMQTSRLRSDVGKSIALVLQMVQSLHHEPVFDYSDSVELGLHRVIPLGPDPIRELMNQLTGMVNAGNMVELATSSIDFDIHLEDTYFLAPWVAFLAKRLQLLKNDQFLTGNSAHDLSVAFEELRSHSEFAIDTVVTSTKKVLNAVRRVCDRGHPSRHLDLYLRCITANGSKSAIALSTSTVSTSTTRGSSLNRAFRDRIASFFVAIGKALRWEQDRAFELAAQYTLIVESSHVTRVSTDALVEFTRRVGGDFEFIPWAESATRNDDREADGKKDKIVVRYRVPQACVSATSPSLWRYGVVEEGTLQAGRAVQVDDFVPLPGDVAFLCDGGDAESWSVDFPLVYSVLPPPGPRTVGPGDYTAWKVSRRDASNTRRPLDGEGEIDESLRTSYVITHVTSIDDASLDITEFIESFEPVKHLTLDQATWFVMQLTSKTRLNSVRIRLCETVDPRRLEFLTRLCVCCGASCVDIRSIPQVADVPRPAVEPQGASIEPFIAGYYAETVGNALTDVSSHDKRLLGFAAWLYLEITPGVETDVAELKQYFAMDKEERILKALALEPKQAIEVLKKAKAYDELSNRVVWQQEWVKDEFERNLKDLSPSDPQRWGMPLLGRRRALAKKRVDASPYIFVRLVDSELACSSGTIDEATGVLYTCYHAIEKALPNPVAKTNTCILLAYHGREGGSDRTYFRAVEMVDVYEDKQHDFARLTLDDATLTCLKSVSSASYQTDVWNTALACMAHSPHTRDICMIGYPHGLPFLYLAWSESSPLRAQDHAAMCSRVADDDRVHIGVGAVGFSGSLCFERTPQQSFVARGVHFGGGSLLPQVGPYKYSFPLLLRTPLQLPSLTQQE